MYGIFIYNYLEVNHVNLPKLVVNKNSKFPEEFYQITNVSEDGTTFDFMGFKNLSINNLFAANIIRDRINLNYYDNLDFDLTSEDLDKIDIECIAQGIVQDTHELDKINPNVVATRPKLKPLDWKEFECQEGEEDMTREEIEEIVTTVVRRELNSFLDKLIPLASVPQGFSKEEVETINEDIKSDEMASDETEERINDYKEAKEETKLEIKPNISLYEDEEDVKNFKEMIVNTYGELDDERNYMSFKDFFVALIGEEAFEENQDTIKHYVSDTCKAFNIKPLNKKVYKGTLRALIIYGAKFKIFGDKEFFGEDITNALHI